MSRPHVRSLPGTVLPVLGIFVPILCGAQHRSAGGEVHLIQAAPPTAASTALPGDPAGRAGVGPELALQLLGLQLCGGGSGIVLPVCGGSGPTASAVAPPAIPDTGNHATIIQKGNGNLAQIVQQGDRNATLAVQKGNSNTTLVLQDGFENLFAVWLDGHNNFVDVVQRGDKNSYILDFAGDNHNSDHHQILQEGSGLSALQSGTGSFLFGIEQRGRGMAVTIEHNGGTR